MTRNRFMSGFGVGEARVLPADEVLVRSAVALGGTMATVGAASLSLRGAARLVVRIATAATPAAINTAASTARLRESRFLGAQR
ncbi:MAG: hypothetical protein WKF57_09455 [Nakamurella sp.]